MDSGNFREAYLRAQREKPALGFSTGARPEPTLDEARAELAQAVSRLNVCNRRVLTRTRNLFTNQLANQSTN